MKFGLEALFEKEGGGGDGQNWEGERRKGIYKVNGSLIKIFHTKKWENDNEIDRGKERE